MRSRIRFRLLAAVFVVLYLASCSRQADTEPAVLPTQSQPAYPTISIDSNHFLPAWGQSNLWDDGQAEVALYYTQKKIDGIAYQFESAIITERGLLKEDILSCRWLYEFEAFDFPRYQYTAFTFERKKPYVWNAYEEVNMDWTGIRELELERMATGIKAYIGNEQIEAPYSYRMGQLPFLLRSLIFQKGIRLRIPLLKEVRISDDVVGIDTVLVEVLEKDSLTFLEETYPCWKLELTSGSGDTANYWFMQQYPNMMVRLEKEGFRMMLKSKSRIDIRHRKHSP